MRLSHMVRTFSESGPRCSERAAEKMKLDWQGFGSAEQEKDGRGKRSRWISEVRVREREREGTEGESDPRR